MPNISEILTYVPLSNLGKTKFRIYHVEALLNQCADLIEQSIDNLREIRALDYSHNQVELDIDLTAKELAEEVARQKAEYYKRAKEVAELRHALLTGIKEKGIQDSFEASANHADLLYAEGEAKLGRADFIRAGQNKLEKHVELLTRDLFEKPLAAKSVTWATEDSQHADAEINIRAAALQKRQDLRKPHQPLALDWQKALVEHRLAQNLADVLDRWSVAKVGLKSIYDYDPPKPVIAAPTTVDELATNLYVWIRSAIESLVAYGQRDQAFTRIISLRTMLNGGPWPPSANDRFTVTFPVTENLFTGHENVRLRGIGASLLGNVGTTPWSLIVGVPRKAIYMRGHKPKAVEHDLLPKCHLGRVENRTSPRPIEICGMISMTNLSPIGQVPGGAVTPKDAHWSVEVIKPTSVSESFAQLEDIFLELSVVGVPEEP